MYFTSGPRASAPRQTQSRRPRGESPRRPRLLFTVPGILAISLLALALPVTVGGTALPATTGGVTISPPDADSILTRLQSLAALAARPSGFLQLGGINGGEGGR